MVSTSLKASMHVVKDAKQMKFDAIPENPLWNTGEEKELKIHRIHSYPARFPAFITTKALEFAESEMDSLDWIADIFCGCGTVAYEAKRNNINFWGCDINPIATMIAKTKSKEYKKEKIKRYFDEILYIYCKEENPHREYENANDRLKYWYRKNQFEELSRLKRAIETAVSPMSHYRLFFLCAFSNILKPTSRWLTKSIKPQVDPDKNPADVEPVFIEQCKFMMAANEESDVSSTSRTEIVTANILDKFTYHPQVDMIITSPPYVTSYEYADLHQLSVLWLGYTNDYRKLRNGSIGSLYHIYNFDRELKRLNHTGTNIVFRLLEYEKSKARSVAKFFLDMQEVAKKCFSMLTDNGLALFVIGDTEYKGVRIENARHLSESLLSSGFSEVFVTKRHIMRKILTPYRDSMGRFTTDKNIRKVYAEEFIIIGRK
ncbi:class I SAM-dependent methyltransferase [Acidobacteriota bacterium]